MRGSDVHSNFFQFKYRSGLTNECGALSALIEFFSIAAYANRWDILTQGNSVITNLQSVAE